MVPYRNDTKQYRNGIERIAKQQKMFRLDDQMIIQIDLYARVLNASHNAFVTEAIRERVKRVALEESVDWRLFTPHSRIPGGLECAMFVVEGLEWDEEDGTRRKFVLEHAQFFYENPHDLLMRPDHRKVHVLWPRLKEFMQLWGADKPAFAASKAMAEVLKQLDIEPPPWGEDESHSAAIGPEQRRGKVRGADTGSSSNR